MSVSPDVFLLCLVLLLAVTVMLPIGAAGMVDCESSDSGQELLPVLFHAMRFTSCGGTETHNGWSTKHKHGWTTRKTRTCDRVHKHTHALTHTNMHTQFMQLNKRQN